MIRLCGFFLLLFSSVSRFSCAQQSLLLVENGKPNAAIIISSAAPAYISEAANDLQYHIRLSSGVQLPVVTDKEAGSLGSTQVKIAVGTSRFTEGKISVSGLQFEEFHIKTDMAAKAIYLVANDGPDNPATHWAVCELLERIIDAKWLWPGELGTYVAKKSTVSTASIDYKWISPYDFRLYKRVTSGDGKKWMTRQRIARRREFQENSNNQGWHEKYFEKYPEMFARTPDGRPYNTTWEKKNPKFRLDNPKYFELMLEDYEAKGKPPVYTLFPTDGVRYDAYLVQGADPLQVYRGEVPVTKAYLDFYRKFDSRVNGANAVTSFDILAYSAYYKFPDNYNFNGKNFNLWFVDRDGDTLNWKKWAATGAKMYLRPNWWNLVSFGPYLTYNANGRMVDFCKKNGMQGFKIDGFKDNWALQGLNYYVLARQGYTTKTTDEIAEEYFKAFGAAAADVKQYITACAANAAKFDRAFLENLAGEMDVNDAGLSNVEILPGLYPAALRNSLSAILEKAEQKVSGQDKQRVEWLMSGLTVTNLVCDYVTQAMANPQQPPANGETLLNKVKQIEAQYPYSITARSFEAVMKKKFKPQNKPPKKK